MYKMTITRNYSGKPYALIAAVCYFWFLFLSTSASITVTTALSLPPCSIVHHHHHHQHHQHHHKIKVNQYGKPRLASLVEKMVGVGTRIGLLLGTPSSVQELSVQIGAKRNRDVIGGKLQNFNVHVTNSRSIGKILQLSELNVNGKNLDFGYWPFLMTTIVPLLVWKLLRRMSFFTLLVSYGLYKLYSTGILNQIYHQQRKKTKMTASTSTSSSSSSSFLTPFILSLPQTIIQKISGRPCSLRYQITMSENDINNSMLLKNVGFNSILRTIMLNSILKEIATTADTIIMLNNNNNHNHNNAVATTRFQQQRQRQQPLLLRGTGNNDITDISSTSKSPTPLPPSLAQKQQQQQKVGTMKQERNNNNNNNNNNMLTKLLQATDFQLTNVTFSKDGKMYWYSDAIFPHDNDNNYRYIGSDQTTKLSYVLRTTPKLAVPTTTTITEMNPDSNNNEKNQKQIFGGSINFENPEIKFSLGAAIQGPFEKFLPDVWLPVGSGVALFLAESESEDNGDGERRRRRRRSQHYHRIQSLDIKEGNCTIQGNIDLFQSPSSSSSQQQQQQQQQGSKKNTGLASKALKAADDVA